MLSRVVARVNAVGVTGTACRSFASATPVKIQRPKHTGKPTLESTVAEIKYLSTVYSIAASATQLPKEKLEFVVREIKADKDLPLAREALEAYEKVFLGISTHCTGSFVSKCIKNNKGDLALEWMEGSKSLPKHIVNGTAANLIQHFGEVGEFEKGLKVYDIIKSHDMDLSYKVFNSLINLSKKQGNYAAALEFASEASKRKAINSHGFVLLLRGLSESELKEKLPTVQGLIHLSQVQSSPALEAILSQTSETIDEDEHVEEDVEEVVDESSEIIDEDASEEETEKKDP